MASGFHDAGRAVLRVAGAEARDWLQGLVTNDVRRLGPDAPLYAALLSAQGKYLFDFILVAAEDGAVLIDVAADRAAALAQRLSMYRLRRAVTVEPTDLAVVVQWGEGAEGLPDPRDPILGRRTLTADPAAALAGVAPATRADWDTLRVSAAVPDSGADLVPDDSYILEHRFDALNGVDFRKGCYVGQEVTARMRHKTELRKGMLRVRLDGVAVTGAEIVTAEGKPAGRLGSVAGDRALAHLRFDRAAGPLIVGDAGVTPEDAAATGRAS